MDNGLFLHTSNFLPADLDIEDLAVKQFSVSISGADRAMLDCCYLAPNLQELSECYELMKQQSPPRHRTISVGTVWLHQGEAAIFLADHFRHVWFEFLDLSTINLGKGKRRIVTEEAKYDSKYQWSGSQM